MGIRAMCSCALKRVCLDEARLAHVLRSVKSRTELCMQPKLRLTWLILLCTMCIYCVGLRQDEELCSCATTMGRIGCLLCPC